MNSAVLFYKTRKDHCSHCGRDTSLRKYDERQIAPRLREQPSSYINATTEETWVCDFCDQVTLELVFYAAVNDSDTKEVAREQAWPPRRPRALDAGVPEAIRSAFEEGSRCEVAGAMRGAAAMYRMAVEVLCKDQGTTAAKLYHMIEELGTKNLPAEIVKDLHEARMLGNDSIHDGLRFSADEVADVADLIVEATVHLYVQPADRAAMRAARQARRSGTGVASP